MKKQIESIPVRDPKERLAAAVEQCKRGNFTDLDFLLDIFGSTQPTGGSGPNTHLSELISPLRDTTGCHHNYALKLLLLHWKDLRSDQMRKQEKTS